MNSEAVLQKVSDVCRRKHLSYATEKCYVGWVQSYIGMLSSLPAEWSSEEKVSAFLTREAKRGVAAATQSQALNAVLFDSHASSGVSRPAGFASLSLSRG